MSTYEVLCVGGPADGTWKIVQDRAFEVAELPQFDFTADTADAVIESFTRHQYHVDRMALFGFSVWIAVCERQFRGSTERNKAILRALLQRDVAARDGGPVSTRSKQKGTTAEREVVRYLQQWWPAAERRALSGNKDKGDVAGIPGVVVEVKAAKTQLIGPWQRETLVEMENAGVGLCALVVKRPYKPVHQWDAYLPWSQLQHGEVGDGWVRMDLQLAVAFLLFPSLQSSPITAST